MELEEIIIKTKTNFIFIGFFFIGVIFFGYLAYIISGSPIIYSNGTNEKVSLYIKWILFVVFILFSIGCLYNIIGAKIYSLTKKKLIINFPLLLFKKIIPLSTIEKVSEKNININMSRGISYVEIFKGKETLIELTNGKKIKLNSLTIANYIEFKKTISKLV